MKSYFVILCIFFIGLCCANTSKDSISNPNTTTKVGAGFADPTVRVRNFETLTTIAHQDFRFLNTQGEFTDTYLRNNFKVPQETNEDREAAKATFAKLDETNNYVDTLAPDDLVTLPVGVKKTIGNVDYILGISGAQFTPTYTELIAFIKIILPQKDDQGNPREIFFGANNMRLSHVGGIMGEANLVLLGDVPISIQGGNALIVLKGGFDMETGEVTNHSYVTIDCDGFKDFTLMAQVQFSRKLLEPINDEKYTVDDTIMPDGSKKRVSADFKIIVDDWNDILAEVSLPKFQMTSFRGTVFEVNSAVFDFSDIRNVDDIQFPEDYEQYMIPNHPEAWRGVYIKNLQVALPEQFKRKNTKERIKLKAEDFLVDGVGVSGKFSVNDILPLSEGVASGWQFSVDHIQAKISANSLTGASFKGKVILPITKPPNTSKESKEDESEVANEEELSKYGVGYQAVINPVNKEYILTTGSVGELRFDLWKAKAKITENSYVELKVKDKDFRPKAILHGSMSIISTKENNDEEKEDKKTDVIDFPEVKFQDLNLQTEAPLISIGYLGYTGKVAVGKFPVTVSELELRTTNETATLSFNVGVNLMKDKITAEGGLGIVAKIRIKDDLQRWNYDKIKMDEIKVDADLGAIAIKGELALMNNDPIYGNGFKGLVSAKFKSLGETEIKSNALFGMTDFRYWYVDALVDNLNIQTGTPFSIKGFGGGAYYRMKKLAIAHQTGIPSDDNGNSAENSSGIKYTPDETSALGVKAMILYANAANPKVFNGSAAFEIAFNQGYGVDRISIYGDGHMMEDFEIKNPKKLLSDNLRAVVDKESGIARKILNTRKESNLIGVSKEVYPDNVKGKAGIHAYAAIEYDFNADALHGMFDVYINVAGGGFRGKQSANRAGMAALHFEKGKWYVHVGTPDNRLGLEMGIGPAKISSGSYIMIGSEIPTMPSPPAVVTRMLGTDKNILDRSRDDSVLSDGRGFAFGSNFSMDTGDLTFMVFYANFQAGVGFDVMVRDYGTAECSREGRVGINGWYANGQGYAYLQGELGINVNLFVTKKRVTILSTGASVLLQTKLPNPSWFKGHVAGHFNILGGAVKGDYNFKVALGTQCEFVDDQGLDGLQMIADITPAKDAIEVDVYTVPQVGFNMKVNKPFELIDDEGNPKKYKIKLNEFKILENGKEVRGKMEWNENNDLLSFTSEEILAPNTKFQLQVKVNFEEYKNGSWSLVYKDGTPAQESKTISFTTGVAPGNIPLSDIIYCYPTVGQEYMYAKEHTSAFITLKRGRKDLFEKEGGYTHRATFNNTGTSIESNVKYDIAQKRITIPIPTDMMSDSDYNLTLTSIPPETDLDSNIKTNYAETKIGENTSLEVKSNKLEETLNTSEEVELLKYNFHTSQYNTFKEKVAAKTMASPIIEIIYGDVHALQASVEATEPFSYEELIGSKYTENKPLIQAEALLTDRYYTSEIFPLIYQGYPLDNRFTVDRDIQELGLPPKKAVETLGWYLTYLEGNNNSALLQNRLPYRYHLPMYYKKDFVAIQHKVVNAHINGSLDVNKYNHIVQGKFPYIKQGEYDAKFTYILPGGKKGTIGQFMFNKPN